MITSVSLTIFFTFHFYLTSANFTTIEFAKQLKSQDLTNNIDPETRSSRYSISTYKNLKQVLGISPICWFLPIQCGSGSDSNWNNGINFSLNSKYEYELIKSI